MTEATGGSRFTTSRQGHGPNMLFLIGLIAVAFFVAIYAVVVRGSLGLVKKRLHDEPELGEALPADEKADDELPTNIEY